MKRFLLLTIIIGLIALIQGCALYASPYGYSPGYSVGYSSGYAPGYSPGYYGNSLNYNLGFSYSPYGYNSFRRYGRFGAGPGYYGWGGRRWGGGYGRGGYWGGHRGWHGRW